MSLMKWEPFKLLEDFPMLPFAPFRTFDFAVDVYEDKGNVIAEMNLPGLKLEDISVTFQNGSLKVAAKREEEKEKKEKDFFFKEIKRGTFERVIALPTNIKIDKTEAHYLNGVLKIVMPMVEPPKVEKVKVTVQ
jgi:HSP20 family protein